MRRIVSSILAILVLSLSCFPCCAADVMAVACDTPATVSKAVPQHEQGCMDNGCSPFCSCSCCAGFALPQNGGIRLLPPPACTEELFAAYRPRHFAEVFLPIWQPPGSA